MTRTERLEKQRQRERARWAADPEFRARKAARNRAWWASAASAATKRRRNFTPLTRTQKDRRNARARERYATEPEYKARRLAATATRRAAPREVVEIKPLAWNADEQQEAALARLEGRDPTEAIRAMRRRENSWLYRVTQWPTRFAEPAL